MPPPRPVADAAESYAAGQTVVTDEAMRLTETAVGRLNGDPAQWRDAVADNATDLLTLQQSGAALADPYLDRVLAAQGADAVADAVVVPGAFADLTDGGGSWLRRLIYVPISVYQDLIGQGRGAAMARSRAQFVASSIVLTGMQDSARSAVTTAMFARPAVKLYVRALRGKTCARCAVLAGRKYRVAAFRRHPRCDCYMIPAAEDAPDDWTTDPAAYFRSLTTTEQDAVFTESGAEAIRLGGDIAQIVNAERGVTAVNEFGRDLQITTEGTTVRGLAGQRLAAEQGTRRVNGLRTAVAPRLMPDEIFQLAEQEGWDRDEVLRQLRRFAYVL